MAAAAPKMAVDSEDSSSDEEALKRCQEAVWETRSDKKKDGDSSVQQSKRVVVADHEHDGNELQVTQGFRAHVAKKLGHLLDSSITELQTETLAFKESAKCGDDDDEGWRLFSTSVPSSQTADEAPIIARRRPVPSSSDSDSEMETRLREAVVSVTDLLPASSLQSALPQKKKKMAEREDSHVVKKKKKRKPNQEEGEQVDSADSSIDAQRNGKQGNTEQEHTQAKVKRKKKKKREEVLN